ncbi:MAG TPA: glycosyltransferase family 4 protein [Solirubrobacteraceae bacterium]|nr:glycosyltransferase family 4 protein [Solirubrobacteraceae bacterium]
MLDTFAHRRHNSLVGFDKPRVAFVLWSGDIGGAETQIHLLAREFRTTDIDASIIFVTRGGPLTKRLARDNIPWYTLGFRRGSAVTIHPRRLLKALNTYGSAGVVLPDVGFLVAALRLGGYKSPIIAIDHGSLLQMPYLPTIKRRRLIWTRSSAEKFSYEHVVVSNAMRDEVLRYNPRAHCTVIYNGVDLPTSISPPELTLDDSLIVGCVGRLTGEKGLQYVIRALAGQDAILRIAGDGRHRARLESLAREVGVSSRVEFLGWIHDVQSFWRECHVAIMPSIGSESFGLAAAEAMAAARPVIVSQQVGLVEIVGSSGVIVPPGDTDTITRVLERFSDAPDDLRSIAIRSRQRAELLFDVRQTSRAYMRLLRLDLYRDHDPERSTDEQAKHTTVRQSILGNT